MILEDFKGMGNFNIQIADLPYGVVGQSERSGENIFINSKYLTGTIPFGNGNGSLAWNSAHEITHLILNKTMNSKYISGKYKSIDDLGVDIDSGQYTARKMISKAVKVANKKSKSPATISGWLSTVSLEAVSYYNANKMNESITDIVGRYIQYNKSKKDIMGKTVYNDLLKQHKRYVK